jgi:hypothetical protein
MAHHAIIISIIIPATWKERAPSFSNGAAALLWTFSIKNGIIYKKKL